MIKTLLYTLLLSLLLVLPVKATQLDENGCVGFANTAKTLSMLTLTGAKTEDLIPDDLQDYPKDIQQLFHLLLQLVTTEGKDMVPEQHYKGVLDFCVLLKGNVPEMADIMQKALGTPI